MDKQLAAPFPVSVISWRVGSTNSDKTKGMALAYIDARDAQDRLNSVCGPFGWQCRHEVSSDKRVTCHVGIRNPENGEWVWKSDGAGETDYEGEKGSYSDSFKRACVKWGIGRYLYEMDSPWVAIESKGRSYTIPAASQKALNDKLEKTQAAYFAGSAPDRSRAISAGDETWNSYPEDQKAEFLKMAAEVIVRVANDPADAYDWIKGQRLTNEEFIALGTQLPSNVRTAIKKAESAAKESK